MRYALPAALVVVVGCSSPTAPTYVPPPIVVVPPVVTPPPPPAFPPNDSRFDLAFYKQLVHNALELNGGLVQQRRQTEAPKIYLRTSDDAGRPIDAFTLTETAAALINTAGSLTGVFGLAGLDQGTDTREGQAGWITVRWSDRVDQVGACGRAAVGGDLITLYPYSPGCRCAGGPAVRLIAVKHELGHALGFWHTDGPNDLMHAGHPYCDLNPSDREKYHAAIAYQRPNGSLPF